MQNNSHLSSFFDFIKDRYAIESEGMDYHNWVSENTILKNRKFTTSRYPFQRAILNDTFPKLAVIKCSQVGLTEIQSRKMAALLHRNRGTTGIFSFPDKKLRDIFSQTRLQPLLENSPVFNPNDGGRKPLRSVQTCEINRESFLHVLVALESSATSVSADFLMVDEVDLSDQDALALYESRLQDSDFKYRHDFSTPTFTDYGIESIYADSDQREYLVCCSSCNHWQIPLWKREFVRIPGLSSDIALEDIDLQIYSEIDWSQAFVGCEKCGAELDLSGQDCKREWVALNPKLSNLRHGYRVRPFSTERIGIKYIVEQFLSYKKKDFLQGWYNTVLGQPHTAEDARISEAAIIANMTTESAGTYDSLRKYSLGIDVGDMCHVVLYSFTSLSDVRLEKIDIVNSRGLIEYVKNICAQYHISTGGIDRYPYTPTAEAVLTASNMKVYPIEYSSGVNIHFKESSEINSERHFQINRTWIIDQVAKKIRSKELPMKGLGAYRNVLKEHLQNMVRKEQPEKPAMWVKLNKEDHFFHACAFAMAGVRIFEHLHGIENRDKDPRIGFMFASVDTKMEGDILKYSPMGGSRIIRNQNAGFNERTGLL